ncbi:hypothetical protein Taro_004628 [Colocasia esculenta]|uniref:Translation initiation factor IF-2, chloroplastic n=1 Tax=Colocasia esculenta TaxID=4460 RepID=A0A843TMV9_COLES|nr:hypothetical protein [Colocasia esculenta]
MASPASVATLGGAKASLSGTMECCHSSLVLGRIRVVSRVSYSSCLLARRWPHGVCKCMVRTDLMEKGSLESTFRGTSNSISGGGSSSSSKDEDADVVLKPAPKPVLSARPTVVVEPTNSLPWSPAKLVRDDRPEKRVEDRERVIESLGEVLEKAEKLETATSVKLNSIDSRTDGKVNTSSRVANVERVVKEVQKVNKERDVVKRPADRKPILIDKFAPKKPVVDPLIAQAVLAPVKPGKGPPPSKVKEERQEDASELNVSIPGAAAARTGRKWTKASRKAARLKAAKDAAPVKVEILEGVKPDSVQTLNKDMVKMICKEYEVEVIEADEVKVEQMAKKKEILDDEDLDMLEDRPPIVTIMGHVDHGKTTLLDYIRKSKVVASEAGGITQGIGAYKVEVPVDGKIAPCVFVDTPGHEAFAAMRARGARVTDIAIIVVAADDGVRPQTSEAIAHAKAAGVPIIDKNGANPDRVMQELSSVGLMPEDWGGDVPMVQISALKGENVDDLLETAMLVAELQELKANPHRNAKGTVIEAGLEKSKGPMATFIVQNGTLKGGDVVVCGEAFGKVRALFDDRGKRVDNAGPSMAVQVIGLNNVPIAGDEFEVVDSLDIARERADACAESLRAARISAKAGEGKVTLSSIAFAVSAGNQSGLDLHQLNIILKVDVQGSIEAIRHAIQVLPQDNVSLKFLLQAPGDVSTSDVDLAFAAEAIIFGFNVKAPGSVKSYADKKTVEIRLYRVIYDLIDDMRNAMEGLLESIEEQISVGAAEVRKVNAGLECGIGIDDYLDWEAGDVIEAFDSVQRRRTLEEASATVTAALAGAGVV